MPAISKIRLTNVVYEDGAKRFNNEVFNLDGHNVAFLLENGGGKTVFIHTVLQAILPHTNLGDRKIKETLQLENAPAHIGIEWIINERPRRYLTTAVSLFLHNNKLESYRYAFEYEHNHPDNLESMPFVRETTGGLRPAYKEEISEYYSAMKQKSYHAKTFDTISGFHEYIENYKLIKNEWESIVKINRDEGGIEQFFENCRTTTDLYDRLLIPTVEDTIEGLKSSMFADLFEQQREGFKKYRDLQKSMKEHRAIQEELVKYVKEFEDYSKREAAYETTKQRAKGLLEAIFAEERKVKRAIEENEANWEKWKTDEKLYERQKVSYHILQERGKESELEADYLEKQARLEAADEKLRDNKQLVQQLSYAKLKQDLITQKQLRDQYKTNLDKYDAESEVAEYESELEEENAKLHGYFLAKIEEHEKTILNLRIEQRPYNETIEKLTEQIVDTTELLDAEKQQLSFTKGQMESKQDELEQLKQQLLANPEQEDVVEEFKKWTARHQLLDDEIIALAQEKKNAEQNIVALEMEKEEKRGELNELIVKIHDEERNEQEMQKAHDMLIEKLTTVRAIWKAIDDLHLKESSVRGSLEELETRYEREREELLLKERLARRFVDDYDGQDIFFADAFLQERLFNWQNDLYVVTGPEYFANLGAEDQAIYRTYPLWPLTLVTTALDREKLMNKLEEVEDRLQFPLSILTVEEAKQIGMKGFTETWVAPQHWETNLDEAEFTVWKANLAEKAGETTKLRQEKEQQLSGCREVIAAFEQFFTNFPKEKKDQIREVLHQHRMEKEVVERKINQIETSIKQVKLEIDKIEQRLEESSSEFYGLKDRIQDGVRYIEAERQWKELAKKQSEVERRIAEFEKEILKLKREKQRYEVSRDELAEQIADNKLKIEILQADSMFLKVKDFTVKYTDEAREVIEERREKLQRLIEGIRQHYGEIKTKYEHANNEVARLKGEMAELVKSSDSVDTSMDFPVDGESQLQRAKENVRIGEDETKKLSIIVYEAKGKFDTHVGRVQSKLEQFEREFSGEAIYDFEIVHDEISEFLQKREANLVDRKAYLDSEKKRLEQDYQDIDDAKSALEKYEVAHRFHSTAVTAISLTEKEMRDYTYGRVSFVDVLTKELTEKAEALQVGKEKIEKVKDQFRYFCRNQISDRKMRETAMSGIETKNTYEEVLHYQQNMLIAVERADKIARDFISKQDQEVQAFINNIHNHLVTVTEQLQEIPRKTRVKVGDKWREIFKFTIPEWTEEDGKTRIRNHMDWILEQLEQDYFKNEQGLEDSAKVRKEIETWLHTKQLLQVVMDQQGMKVSCRKVTNDNQVSSRFTSWEQSNQWSGGEKWSKNMTLFLGILNFVAEKKQHIDGKMKRHRAVILDNPFGKASSDHVLSPVFFIAEQLGFQIIALTAHADGKFLQDYFPIIYSLKLRATTDESKQIMTKERSLHHAYFRDHDPNVMERLEEKEQLELF